MASKLQEIGLEAGWAPRGEILAAVYLEGEIIYVQVQAEFLNSVEWRSYIIKATAGNLAWSAATEFGP